MNVLEEAVKLFNGKNYKESKKLLLSICDNAIAQYYLGIIYRVGLGLKQDQKEAFKWFLKAAEQGHAASQYLVGCSYTCDSMFMHDDTEVIKNVIGIDKKNIYDIEQRFGDKKYFYPAKGMGVEEDIEKATWWLEASADQGYVDAQFSLWLMYVFDLEVVKNREKANKYLLKAALADNASAFSELGLIKINEKDGFLTGIKYLEKAYGLGDERSPYLIAEEYEQKKQDYETAFEWFSIAVMERDWCEAKVKLGEYYYKGKGVKKDIELAIFWYKKAIEDHLDKIGFTTLREAFEQLKVISEEGYPNAFSTELHIGYLRSKIYCKVDDDGYFNRLRQYHEDGYDVGEFFSSMFELQKKAELGDKQAQIKYGHSFIVDLVVVDSQKELAIDWYLDDAKSGGAEAQYLLSNSYYGSLFRSERNHWLHEAAKQGYPDALYDLAQKHSDDDCLSEYLRYMHLAAESNIKAQAILGYRYAHGNNVERDYATSYGYYQKAAKQLIDIRDIRELVVIKCVMIKYNAGNDQAALLALKGDIDAQLYMGCLYQYGFEVQRNLDKAIYWYNLAHKEGNEEARKQIEYINQELLMKEDDVR